MQSSDSLIATLLTYWTKSFSMSMDLAATLRPMLRPWKATREGLESSCLSGGSSACVARPAKLRRDGRLVTLQLRGSNRRGIVNEL